MIICCNTIDIIFDDDVKSRVGEMLCGSSTHVSILGLLSMKYQCSLLSIKFL